MDINKKYRIDSALFNTFILALLAAIIALTVVVLSDAGQPKIQTSRAVPDSVALSETLPSYVVPTTVELATIAAPVTATTPAVRVTPPTSTTTPATIPPPSWTTFDCDSFRYLFDRHNLPWTFFRMVIDREAHCDPSAYCDRYAACKSKTDRSYGLGQINMLGKLGPYRMELCHLSAETDLFDPAVNVACIAELYRIAGKSPWQ